jgi:hypothetical protein
MDKIQKSSDSEQSGQLNRSLLLHILKITHSKEKYFLLDITYKNYKKFKRK